MSLKTAWLNLQDGLGNRFAWSHVNAIYYSQAQNKLLKDKLDDMETAINAKVAKTDIVQVESTSQSTVPSSAYLKSVKDDLDSEINTLSSGLSEARTYSRTTPGDTTTKIRLEGTYSFQPFLLFGNVKSYLAMICFNNGTPVVTNWGTDKFQVEAVSTTSCNVVIPSYNRITIISSASFSYYSLS